MSNWRSSPPARLGLQVLRIVCAALALFGLATVAACLWLPNLVHHVDARFRQQHMEPTHFLLEAAQARLEDDRDSAKRIVAEHLENDLADVRRGDRREEIRRATAAWLLARYLEDEDSAAALELLADMIEFDPRDIRQRLKEVDLLMAREPTRQHGSAQLRQLFAEIPSDPKISQRMLKLAVAEGDAAAAAETAYYLSQGIRETWLGEESRWRCYWTIEKGRFDRHRLDVVPAESTRSESDSTSSGSEIHLAGEITAEAGELYAFRVNLPPFLAARIYDLTFTFRNATTELHFPAQELLLRSRGIDTLANGGWLVRGESLQVIFFDLPTESAGLDLTAGGEFEIRARLEKQVPRAALDLLASEDRLQQVLSKVASPVRDYVLRHLGQHEEWPEGAKP